jgi:hypothetical protein
VELLYLNQETTYKQAAAIFEFSRDLTLHLKSCGRHAKIVSSGNGKPRRQTATCGLRFAVNAMLKLSILCAVTLIIPKPQTIPLYSHLLYALLIYLSLP